MYGKLKDFLTDELRKLEEQKLYKHERIIESAQGAEIVVKGKKCLNFCANNYLGLSSHPELIRAAHEGIDHRGYGLSSVRFICGTQDIHKTLERKVSEFLGMDDTILFSSCFDANGAVFEPLLGEGDAIISDALNHASIIDGVRLCKAQRWAYKHSDMRDVEELDPATGKTAKGLERCLKEANEKGCRFKMIATDGAFSMDGDVVRLKEICDLADKYDALVMVDDSHASGFMGKTGRGTHEHCGVMGRVDIITTTFGKALGGASGGCISGRKEIIDWMRNKARPYLFSNTVAPSVVMATIRVMDMLSSTTELRDKLERNTQYFREKMTAAGFDIIPGVHPITPIMFGKYPDCSKLAVDFANAMLDEGIYVIAFSFPVVPRGKDRIRVQISAAHEQHHLEQAIAAFTKVGRKLNMIK
ncbi:MAG TPA: glycine C-acetyltransferase [Acidobacteriota bacterium]|jgi:glycine C-acetyltransferase|nr:glycine C-acetyltransferase [Acidobacteriota bacterium]HNR39970.1 glycine C-acetyltransferase [Acidobacteriota bacterium]HNU02020.1 glycine C-acetyltransferase [Acidobacteriota bacterium]HPB28526.1 glycine C-acetyltransferase [Acidobacteriota bacterium]HQP75041.1 glycine C-acetyltransferase [Acidobacteriota bacterium]